MVQVVKGLPPNYAVLRKHFRTSPGTIYTYGDTIYASKPLSEDLWVHELVHVEQQRLLGPEAWWDRYVADPEFRLAQELAAYRAQYRTAQGRQAKRTLLRQIARDLASPLYGGLISRGEAERLIVDAED